MRRARAGAGANREVYDDTCHGYDTAPALRRWPGPRLLAISASRPHFQETNLMSAQVRPSSQSNGAPIHESGSFAAHLKTLERKIPLRARYGNFIGGEVGGPAQGRLLRQYLADHRAGDLPDPALAGRGCRARHRCRARGRAEGWGRTAVAERARVLNRDRGPHGAVPAVPRRRRDLRQRQAHPRNQSRGPAAGGRSFPLLRELRARAGGVARRARRRHGRLPLSRAARRGGADHSLEFSDPDGGLETRARRSPPATPW